MTEKNKIRITIDLDSDQHRSLTDLSIREDTTKANIIRKAFKLYELIIANGGKLLVEKNGQVERIVIL